MMAKLNSILVVMLAILLLTLSACGGQEEPAQEPAGPEVTELTDEEILEMLEQQRRERREREMSGDDIVESEDEIRERETEREREREQERVRERERERERETERERTRTRTQPASVAEGYLDLHNEGGDYTIQVAAHRNEYMAKQSADIWLERGYEFTFVRQTGDFDTGDTWFKVYLARFDSFSEADQISGRINRDYPESNWPRPLPEGR